MRTLFASLFALLFGVTIAHSEGEPAGQFDYYVLSLSWSPTWCVLEGDARQSPQCDDSADFGWVLHGLWPQYEQGWPSYCRSDFRAPSRRETAEMADIMGTSGAAWHQWKKHGTCSGLSPQNYFRAMRHAYQTLTRPPVFRKLVDSVRLPASVIEDAFLAANPNWRADMLTITCKNNYIQEARLCLTRNLEPRICGNDTIRDCRADRALLEPVS